MKKTIYTFFLSSLLIGFLCGCSDDDEISVKEVSSITIEGFTEDGFSVEEEHDLQLKVKVLPEDADNKKVKYQSSNIESFTIDENGLIKAIKPGEGLVTVLATDGSGIYSRSLLVVTAKFMPVSDVTINGFEDDNVIELTIGEPLDISLKVSPSNATNKDMKVESLDGSIFTVTKFIDSATGEVKYKMEGVTTGTATDQLKISTTDGSDIVKTYTVKVKQYVELPRTDWLIIDKSSADNENGTTNTSAWDKVMFDGLYTTYWHSRWGSQPSFEELPHWIVIDMQQEYDIKKVQLGLRETATGSINSYLKGVEISTSTEYVDSTTEFEDAASYEYSQPKTVSDQNRQFKFTSRKARYVKINFPSSHRGDGGNSVNLAEFWAYELRDN